MVNDTIKISFVQTPNDFAIRKLISLSVPRMDYYKTKLIFLFANFFAVCNALTLFAGFRQIITLLAIQKLRDKFQKLCYTN